MNDNPALGGASGSVAATEAALQMAKEWAVNAALTGKPAMATYYTKKALALDIALIHAKRSPNAPAAATGPVKGSNE